MTDNEWKALSLIIPSLSVLAGRLWSMFEHKKTAEKITEIHLQINGTMDRLIKAEKEKSRAQGIKEGLKIKHSKLSNMPDQTWEMTVSIHDNQDDFPDTGDSNTMYIDMSTAPDENPENGSFLYWNGSGYSSFVVGPRPHPHPHA